MKKFIISLSIILLSITISLANVQAVEMHDTLIDIDLSELPICDEVKKDLEVQKNKNDNVAKNISNSTECITSNGADTNTGQQTPKEENKKTEEKYFIKEIPLDKNLQKYTYDLCKLYNINYDLILALIFHESSFDTTAFAYNKNGSFDSGLMQINSCNIPALECSLGITNLQDPYENILAGISILSQHINNLGEHDGLMAYNMGLGGYYNCIDAGIFTTEYVDKIIEKKQTIESLPHYS